VFPVAGTGWLASAFGNVNSAPTIASAKKVLRRRFLMFGLRIADFAQINRFISLSFLFPR